MGNCKCCSYPNGCVTLGPSLLIFPALLFTFWGVFSCKFVNYDTERANDMTAIGLFWKSVPLDWSYNSYSTDYDEVERVEVVGACSPFNWFGESIIQYDGPFRAARGFGLIAVSFGCVMTLVVWIIAPCIPISKFGWRTIGLILAVIGLFQLLTLLLLSSKVCSSGCSKLAVGGILSIVSGLLWFVSGFLCFCVGEPIEEEEQIIPVAMGTPTGYVSTTNNAELPQSQVELAPQHNQVLEQTTTEQHVEKDGTVVIEKTTTRADGSVTVTTEVIPPGTTVVASTIAG